MRGRTAVSKNQKLAGESPVRVMVYDFHQDDPAKCTSTRLQKFHLVIVLHSLNQIPPHAIVLNPTSQQTLSSADRPLIQDHGLVGLDCSWSRSEDIFQRRLRGENRRLPALLAGNSTNYAVRGKLTTAEALAAALIITGFALTARQILSPFKWGDTFLSLNNQPLDAYSHTPPDKIFEVEREYFDSSSS